MHRRFHIALALVAVLAASGCTLPADLTAEAGPVSVNDGALAATGYAADGNATVGFNETVAVGDNEYEIGVTGHVTTYAHADHEGRFVVFSTPAPDAVDLPVDLSAGGSERRDVARLFGGLNDTSGLAVEDRRNVTMVGQRTELVTYATNRSGGEQPPLLAHVAVAETDGDAVVAVGIHPQSVAGEAAIARLVEGLERGEAA